MICHPDGIRRFILNWEEFPGPLVQMLHREAASGTNAGGPFARYAARLPGNASAMVTFFALLFGSLTAFAIGRMRIRHGWLVSNCALLTYVIPASFLAIPFYRIMQNYGLANNPWSVIAALVAFATPYAIFVFQEYGRSIPIEVDESARIDGASPLQIYLRIYLPLMAPALVAVGTYALLLAWNEYLYQFLLLSSKSSMTVPVALAQFLSSDQSPWNYMMATAIIYAVPPVAIYYAFRRRMTAGLTMGGVKGSRADPRRRSRSPPRLRPRSDLRDTPIGQR